MAQASQTTEARAWFDQHGWRLQPAELRAGLEERGASPDLVIELIDEGADRRREAAVVTPPPAQPPQPVRRPERPLQAVPNGAVPPQNLEAEEHVLGAMMISPKAIDRVTEILDPADFYRESHGLIYRAAADMHAIGDPVDAVTLIAELERRGELDRVGGRVRIHELAAIVPASANARHYAEIVREQATLRDLIRGGSELAQLGWDREGSPDEIATRTAEIVERVTTRARADASTARLVPGGRFILDGQDEIAGVWGDGDEILWAAGEGLMICGPQGAGKTTVGQQLALARCGLLSRVLGLDVRPSASRVMYLAADRPAQARRSLARMVADHNRDQLDERLVVHPGPPDQLVDHDPRVLLRLCQQAGCDTLIVDSVKDVCLKPSDEESAAYANLAWQYLIGAGVELVLLHHQRKGTDGNRKPDKLDDVYGNQRLYSGLGSVVLLWGEPGDLVVEFRHLKQVREEVGPWNILHDHARGISTVEKPPDAYEILASSGTPGLTAREVAQQATGNPDPKRNDVEKHRRRLERLADTGRVDRIPGEPVRYRVHIPGT